MKGNNSRLSRIRTLQAKTRKKKQEVVLGGGALRGLHHCGFLEALEDRRVNIGTVTGISIGSLLGTFYTNGYTPDEIAEIFIEELTQLPRVKLRSAVILPPALNRLLGGKFGKGLVDLQTLFAQLIEKYDLKPQPNLRIIAYNVLNRTPVVFEGTDYDLLTALCASCAVPLLMRPVWYGQKDVLSTVITLVRSALGRTDRGILVDGGVHHPYAGTFCKEKAIIAKLGFAKALPTRLLPPVDLVLHLAEMLVSPLLEWYFRDPEGHIVIDIGVDDVACMTFSQPRAKCLEMVRHAFDVTAPRIDSAIAAGEVSTRS